jgi:hypothetical protein
MSDLVIRIKKNEDGSASLACVRSDGSTTWQRQNGQLGAVFPPHDLTHYAIEQTLGYDRAFYGLIAEGWEMADFGSPWPRGSVPEQARVVEALVGAFDLERMTGQRSSTDEFNQHVRFALERGGITANARRLTDEELARVREARADLFKRWWDVEAGSTLELEFNRHN